MTTTCNMRASYYPGCSLHAMASDYDESIRAVCETLDVELSELTDWNCCGASSAHFMDSELAVRLAARNMTIAEKRGGDLLVPCAACFHRLKVADKALREDSERWVDDAYSGAATIYHINEFFERPALLEAVRANVKRPLAGLAGVPYYGCLSQRPPKVTDSASPDNPLSMDTLMNAIGMDVRPWSYKTDCCGGSLPLTRPDLVRKLSGDLFEAAQEAGAECIVTDCPLCQSNLDSRAAEIEAERDKAYNLPVFYVTELIALAFDDARVADWWPRHFVDPEPLLAAKALIAVAEEETA